MTAKNRNEQPPEPIALGDRLRALRQEAGLTLRELSDSSGISLTYLNGIEQGKVSPSVETVRKLARFFRIPVSLLVNNQPHSGLPVKLQFIRKMKNLSQKELAALAGVSPGLIAQLELGRVNASLKTVNKLAECLGVSVCYLIMDRHDIDGIIAAVSPELREMLKDPKVQAVIGSICTMSEDQLKMVLNFINMMKNPAF